MNNVDSAPDEIDLHGLYVKEAIDVADKALDEAKKRGSAELRIIVGKVRFPYLNSACDRSSYHIDRRDCILKTQWSNFVRPLRD